jgi:pyrimidine-nucleoside phosphorylase
MFTPAWIIKQKRDGKELSQPQIHQFISGLATGEVADYQASAFLMAVYLQGMSQNETVSLTEALLQSGDHYDLSAVPGVKVDKHSTGGVGDKVSLILAPLAAACGVKVPMMSGRGLGHTGGTLDKLESIEGFNVRLSRDEFIAVLKQVGCGMIGQSDRIVPADKRLYALRDVTGTVECIPLIVASILSKKLAEGANALILDVKVGSGAFMKTKEQARKLAKGLTQVAKKMGLPCRAVLTDMNQPLGFSVGNALEVWECTQILKNERASLNGYEFCSSDLKELTIQLCAQMVELAGIRKNLTEARKLAHAKLADGSAWGIFQELVGAQGGNLTRFLTKDQFTHSPRMVIWRAKKRGYITRINTETIGQILVELGGGRKKVSDSIDPHVGLVFHKKLGARVQPGEPLVTLFAPESRDLTELEALFFDSIEISGARKAVPKLILEVLA